MVQFCANNLQNITGRVLVQVSPRNVYSKEATLAQCYAYDQAFRDAGVSRDRFAIKMAVTGPTMAAAAQLTKEGIRTLGTSLFGLPQAIAASQAGCLFISPYFNGQMMFQPFRCKEYLTDCWHFRGGCLFGRFFDAQGHRSSFDSKFSSLERRN